MNASSIIEKVKKLLNMTEKNGCSESEAQRALALAHKLLAENNLSMSQVEAVQEEEIIYTNCEFDTESVSTAQIHIASNFAEHYGVVCCSTEQVVAFLGEPTKGNVCKASVEFAYKMFLKEWNIVKKTLSGSRGQKLLLRNTYLHGFTSGMIWEIINNECKYALVIRKSDKLLQKLDSLHMRTSRRSHKCLNNNELYEQGYKDGSRVQRDKNCQGKLN